MNIIKKLDEIINSDRTTTQNVSSRFEILLEEMKEIFGDNFFENAILEDAYEYTLFFEENETIYFTTFETYDENKFIFYSYSYPGSNEQVFYSTPNDTYLKNIKSEYDEMKKKIYIYNKILSHPKHRLKSLFL